MKGFSLEGPFIPHFPPGILEEVARYAGIRIRWKEDFSR